MSGLACVARGRRKKGMERGREKSTKEGKGKGASPFPSPLFPYPLTRFDICYAGYEWTRETPGVGCIPYMTYH